MALAPEMLSVELSLKLNQERPLDKVIVTHKSPDLDAVVSSWVMRMVPGWQDAPLQFVEAGSRQHGKSVKEEVSPRDFAKGIHLEDDGMHYAVLDTGLTAFDHHHPGFSDTTTSAARLVCEYLQSQLGDKFKRSSFGNAVREIVRYTIDHDNFQHVHWDHIDPNDHDFTLYQVVEGIKRINNSDEAFAEEGMNIFDGLAASLMGNERSVDFPSLLGAWVIDRTYSYAESDEKQAYERVWQYFTNKNVDRDIFSLKHILKGLAYISADDATFREQAFRILDGVQLTLAQDILPAERSLNNAHSFLTAAGRRGIVVPSDSKVAERVAYVRGHDIFIGIIPGDQGHHAHIGLRPQQGNEKDPNFTLSTVAAEVKAKDAAMRYARTDEDVWFAIPNGAVLTNLPHQRHRFPTQLRPEDLVAITAKHL